MRRRADSARPEPRMIETMKTASMLLAALWLLVLAGCSGQPTSAESDSDAGSEPTVYGRVSVSIDHVETR